MMKWIRDFISGFKSHLGAGFVFDTKFTGAKTRYGRSEAKMQELKNAIEYVERKGLRVHYYLPTMNCYDDSELFRAVEELRLSGHIITQEDGSIFGKIAPINLTSDEASSLRRKNIKLVR